MVVKTERPSLSLNKPSPPDLFLRGICVFPSSACFHQSPCGVGLVGRGLLVGDKSPVLKNSYQGESKMLLVTSKPLTGQYRYSVFFKALGYVSTPGFAPITFISLQDIIMKIRSMLLFTSLLAVMPFVQAADWVAQEYPVKDFSEINVGGDAIIEITEDATEYLRVEADPEVMKRVKVDLSGKRLTLGVKSSAGDFLKWLNDSNEKVRFVVRVKTLTLLNLSGAAHAKVGSLTQPGLVFEASGASHAAFNGLDGKIMAINLSGASHAVIERINAAQQTYELSGAANLLINQASSAEEVKANVSGASNLRAKALIAKSADVEASGASSIDIYVTGNLTAEATGASNINYFGKPTANTEASGAGHVNAKGE